MTKQYFDEEIDQTETKVDEPWDHQFEKEDAPTTRSARIHSNPEASLYTKIIFGVTVLLALVMGIWFVLSFTGVIGKNNTAQQSESKVPRLVIQSQTSAAKDETSASSSISASATSSQTTSTTLGSTTSSSQTTSNASTVARGTTYTVQAGDTLYSISRRYGLTVEQLQSLNGLSGTNLSVGQVLIVGE
ncbi:LysM peptidoglycan-binding domain-containing protein [Granulicatella sp. WM01]|uniref:LysM peptidoglycan-binding domain-containing protein n=1 Tax=unclassified Granulicatella TaxID=2630493 RepID=UPI001ADDDD34|nr:LysM peptidoglycan-binding domain-containing protein [Granulicatella sp. WM01]